MNALRQAPWATLSFRPEHVTDEQLAEMAQEASEIDAHNAAGLAVVVAALQAYKTAHAEFFGRPPETYSRPNRGGYTANPRPPYNSAARALEELQRRVKAARAEREKKRREAEHAEQQRVAALKANQKLAVIIVRYGLPDDADWDDALEALCAKNQYLDLAIAGQQTRSDWSDGFYRVESALKRFKINDERDKDIAADISGRLRSGESDGRTFRDTEWSYGALFELVEDKQLVADAQLCASKGDDE